MVKVPKLHICRLCRVFILSIALLAACDSNPRPSIALADDPTLHALANEAMREVSLKFEGVLRFKSDVYVRYANPGVYADGIIIGRTSPGGREIAVNPYWPAQRENLVHEFNHAIGEQNGIPSANHPAQIAGVFVAW